ncbi:MAG: hypothetical protein JWQ98_3376 [Chlorobi bacterium]|nr:hypothetical protein [Chlorobiota bacterium]
MRIGHCVRTNFVRPLLILSTLIGVAGTVAAQPKVQRQVTAHVVALDQPIMYNRMGATQPAGMIFALQRDVSLINPGLGYVPGNVYLREGKRPRPIVLRLNQGDQLTVYFTNCLTPNTPTAQLKPFPPDSVALSTVAAGKSATAPLTREAGIHVMGMEVVSGITDDGSWAGSNPSGLVAPGQSTVYKTFAEQEGSFLLFSTAANLGGPTDNAGQLEMGMFGTLVVEPTGAEWYRSQVARTDLLAAATSWVNEQGQPVATGAGLPIINYAATYKSGPFSGSPVLSMLQNFKKSYAADSNEIIYSDLTAVITGPNAGRFPTSNPSPSFYPNPAYPDRFQPYREVVIHYHEAQNAVQAFPIFYQSSMAQVVGAGADKFAINYGTGGIGAEIYGNRIGVGPMANCVDCAYEEFFLSAWAVGDPAMIVDVPANASGTSQSAVNATLNAMWLDGIANKSSGTEPPLDSANNGYKATKAFYPDDPSNVYHSYMDDHIKFRISHGGAFITHVHHQHAHQWLHTPNSDNSEYLDSQTLSPGSSFTLEMVYGGSGNRNKTVGDQIFHCHFYPHFAEGMWGMWRVHDVFEAGTQLDGNGRPTPGSRALPDAEIKTGTPIPAIVPMPTIAMAPIPAAVSINSNGQIVVSDTTRSPGFPFYIPGIAGSRAPHPPMDFAQGSIYDSTGKVIGTGALDGGLPRHVIAGGVVEFHNESATDWTKIIGDLVAVVLPENGTPVEQIAMATHAIRNHQTVTPDGGKPATFVLNGLPPVSGAPFADPAVNDSGQPVGTKRVYKAAVIQRDAVFNKKGWHTPQQRMITLWDDVASTVSGSRPPQPFFFRANSDEYVEFWHTNLVPEYYELDDFQVRTPTDILGQHIHLVKFDVTASDGAANGFNYEDGTFSPDVVRERISGINNGGKQYTYKFVPGAPVSDTTKYTQNPTPLKPQFPNPVWGKPPSYNNQSWIGAQTTIQRWFADPLLNNNGFDRTLTTVFTHDHYGPSTHQQAGLYAGLLIEPQGSTWLDPISGVTMGSRADDGGPTSWQANIIGQNQSKSYREFALEFQDLQLAYFANSINTMSPYPVFPGSVTPAFLAAVNSYTGWSSQNQSINSPANGAQLISGNSAGTYSLNYRNEPVPLRIGATSGVTPPNGGTVMPAPGLAGDLAYAFVTDTSVVKRYDPAFNTQPVLGSNITSGSTFTFPSAALTPGMTAGDPFTPLLRAYQNDSIQIRTLVGAHLLTHVFNLNGLRWLFEPAFANSGYKSSQEMSLSEHFEMFFKLPVTPRPAPQTSSTDYLYRPSSDAQGMINGVWGLMRAYPTQTKLPDLLPLPNNPSGGYASGPQGCGCPPSGAPLRYDTVVALTARQALKSAGGALVYNSRTGFADPNALMFFRLRDVDTTKWQLRSTSNVEPLILRARAGDCYMVTVKNRFQPTDSAFLKTVSTEQFENNQIGSSFGMLPSKSVSLSPELVSVNVTTDYGYNVGLNPIQTIAPGSDRTYSWYMGVWRTNTGTQTAVPVEFGTVPLLAPDPLVQYTSGLYGTLIVEPQGSLWVEDSNSHASATVVSATKSPLFREFVMVHSDGVTSKGANSQSGTNTMAVNYRTEPIISRYPVGTNSNLNLTDISAALTDSLVGGPPQTPTFVAFAGEPLRIRLMTPNSSGNEVIWTLHGHVWQEEPYINGSTAIGRNDTSQWQGSRPQLNALTAYDLPISSAGGAFKQPGEYIYRSYIQKNFSVGSWGLVKVTPTGANDAIAISDAEVVPTGVNLKGVNTVSPGTGAFARQVKVYAVNGKERQEVGTANVDPKTGTWSLKGTNKALVQVLQKGGSIAVESDRGGKKLYSVMAVKRIDAQNPPARAVLPAPRAPHTSTRGLLPAGEKP